LTREGLIGIVDLVKNGRVIYSRLTSWILSKIIRTLQIAVFVVLSFLFTGSYTVSAFAIILYFFMTDFVKISLSTDNMQWSRKPDAWNITGLVKISIVLSFLIIAESFGLLYIGFHYFNLPSNGQTLYTFTFEILFYSAMFLIFNVREKRHFWNSKPSKILLAAITLSTIIGTGIATVGIPGLEPLPLSQTLFVILYSAAFSLGFNDAIKFFLVKRTKISW
jgi:magnesium-transporting ATPase (P-type)